MAMPESRPNSASRASASRFLSRSRGRTSPWHSCFLFSIILPVLAAILVYRLDSFDPAPFPLHELTHPPLAAPMADARLLRDSQLLGSGLLQGPEDIAFDERSGTIYTGTADGWIKRVKLDDSGSPSVSVEDWVNTGGRPLGVVLGPHDDVIVADAYKGLLRISGEGAVELLTNGAEGTEFKLTDAAVIADDGIIYFTDASYKYNNRDFTWDMLEGKPHGRLLSFDPVTKKTQVLVRDLYFANGIAISPHQDYLVVCETFMRRCRRYYLSGKEKGRTEKFIDNLPGMPDNIHYDGDGHYWIALASAITTGLDVVQRYPFIRKVAAWVTRYVGEVSMSKNSGIFVVDLEGKPTAHYHDPGLALLSTGLKIGTHLYCGSIIYPYILRHNLMEHPTQATA
uniref:Protein YLS2-like n=1 Tax=Rhizophora mucronata TaxID=61149 RepID=A0A2P2K041_RHIMU